MNTNAPLIVRLVASESIDVLYNLFEASIKLPLPHLQQFTKVEHAQRSDWDGGHFSFALSNGEKDEDLYQEFSCYVYPSLCRKSMLKIELHFTNSRFVPTEEQNEEIIKHLEGILLSRS